MRGDAGMGFEVEVEDHARLLVAAAGDIGSRIAEKLSAKFPILEWLPDPPPADTPHRRLEDMAFIVTGLENETVARRAAELAKQARESASCRYSIALVTESSVARCAETIASYREMRQWVDAVFVVSEKDLKPMHGDAPQVMTALALEEYLVGSMIGDLTRLLTERGLICIDFQDVEAIMCAGGSEACLGIGIAGGEDAAIAAAAKALDRIREQGMDPSQKGAFVVSIKGSTNITMDDFDDVSRLVHDSIHPDADIITGLLIDEAMGGNIRVMVMAKKEAVPVPYVMDERVRGILVD